MFCRQCEQTENHYACASSMGVCGKTAPTSLAQDVLVNQVIPKVAQHIVSKDNDNNDPTASSTGMYDWLLEATFATLTNVNFDEASVKDYSMAGLHYLQQQQNDTTTDLEAVYRELSKATQHEIQDLQEATLNDTTSLIEFARNGLKGTCAYAFHVRQLLKQQQMIDTSAFDEQWNGILHDICHLWSIIGKQQQQSSSDTPDMSYDDLFQNVVLEVGSLNGKVLELLDTLHSHVLGTPTPTPVQTTPVKGKCILVSGHDMTDLLQLCQQTQGTGINIYTHGEMMPGMSYTIKCDGETLSVAHPPCACLSFASFSIFLSRVSPALSILDSSWLSSVSSIRSFDW